MGSRPWSLVVVSPLSSLQFFARRTPPLIEALAADAMSIFEASTVF